MLHSGKTFRRMSHCPGLLQNSYVQRRVTDDSPFVQCDADLITTVCLLQSPPRKQGSQSPKRKQGINRNVTEWKRQNGKHLPLTILDDFDFRLQFSFFSIQYSPWAIAKSIKISAFFAYCQKASGFLLTTLAGAGVPAKRVHYRLNVSRRFGSYPADRMA